MSKTVGVTTRALLVCSLAASFAVTGGELKSLTVCADPGNMPLSNQKREGFENKIAQVIGTALGTGVQYYWRPSIERGLMRTTLCATRTATTAAQRSVSPRERQRRGRQDPS
jgi:hypothetical protein